MEKLLRKLGYEHPLIRFDVTRDGVIKNPRLNGKIRENQKRNYIGLEGAKIDQKTTKEMGFFWAVTSFKAGDSNFLAFSRKVGDEWKIGAIPLPPGIKINGQKFKDQKFKMRQMLTPVGLANNKRRGHLFEKNAEKGRKELVELIKEIMH